MHERTDRLTYGLIAVLFALIAILQTAAIPNPSVFGAHADLLLVVVATWALLRSSEEAMISAPPAALLAGLLGAGAIGTPLLALIVPVGLALFLRQRGSMGLPALLCLIAVSSVWVLLLDLSVDFMGGQHTLRLSGLGSALLGVLILNSALAAILYWPLRLVRKRQLVRRARLSLG